MNGPVRRARRRLLRLGRLFLGRNKLRRPCDRIEGAIIAVSLAAFLTASVGAACIAGHLCRSERAAAVRLRPATAVLSQPGPVAGGQATAAAATWRLPDGAERSGTLTTATVPAIYDAPAGTSVQVWLDHAGPAERRSQWVSGVIVTASLESFAVIAAAAAVLFLCYFLCRVVLDRHRAAGWDSAWAAVGPRWTRRR